MCLVGIFLVDWYGADIIGIISDSKVRNKFTLRLKNEAFQAIMRQDAAYFATHDSGQLQHVLQGDCEEVARQLMHKPLELFQCLMSLSTQMFFLHKQCPGMLWRCQSAFFTGSY